MHFIPDAMGSSPGGRCFRTGDRSRLLADGNIEFLGRTDDQTKIRGHRIEPAEIAAVISALEEVQDCFATTYEAPTGKRSLIAYVVPNDPSRLSPDTLRHSLRRCLPDYMVPSDFILIERLPLNQHGKIDRNALPAPARRVSREGMTTARNAIERRIATIWQRILRIEHVSIYDNFFDLGGTSLLIIQLQQELQSELEQDISAIDLFQYPTIELLAVHLAQRTDGREASPSPSSGRRRLPRVRRNR
jgi:acyl carrier protein